jgi:hypothetical protein
MIASKYSIVNVLTEVSQLPYLDVVKEKGKFVPVHAMKALDGGEWRTSCTGHYIPGKEPRSPLNMNLVDPTVSQGVLEKRIMSRFFRVSKPGPSSP